MPLTDDALRAIARQVPTPFYAYDQGAIRDRFAQLKTPLPEGADIYYSLKANPNPEVVRTLARAGAGCEVCSRAELEIAAAVGTDLRRVIYVGPAKSGEDIGRAMELGIKAIIAESREELRLISALAEARGIVQPVGLRVNPDFASAAARIKMSGVASQFGIDEACALAAVDQAEGDRNLQLVGLHVYLGSRILDEEAIFENTGNILDLARRLSRHLGRSLAFVDIGGGFGVGYFGKERDLDPVRLAAGLGSLFSAFRDEFRRTRIITELGRYLVAEAGAMVTAVRAIKTCKGKTFAVCDGGSNVFAAAAGYGSAFRKNWPLHRVGGGVRSRAYMLAGPLCTPSDTIGAQVMLPELAVGDLLCFERAGAYGPSASPVGFLGFGHPSEILMTAEGPVVVREADPPTRTMALRAWRPLATGGEEVSRVA